MNNMIDFLYSNIKIVVLLGMVVLIVYLYRNFQIKITSKKKNKERKELPQTTSIKKESSEEKIKLLLTMENPVETINNIIDKFILDAGNIYMALNVNFDQEKFITEKETETFKLYVFGSVKKNMTPTIREMISIVHNIDTEDKLDDFLKLRINLYILHTLIKNRKPIS